MAAMDTYSYPPKGAIENLSQYLLILISFITIAMAKVARTALLPMLHPPIAGPTFFPTGPTKGGKGGEAGGHGRPDR